MREITNALEVTHDCNSVALHDLGREPRIKGRFGAEIDAGVAATLDHFFDKVGGARDLANKAYGMLIFPSVVKASMGIGGEYGEGALHIRGRTAGYYNTISASFGFQLGVQERSVIHHVHDGRGAHEFSPQGRLQGGRRWLDRHRDVGGRWSIDSNKVASPVVGFILDPKGLMYNLTLEGSKISRIQR